MCISRIKCFFISCFMFPGVLLAGNYGAEFSAEASRMLPGQKVPQTARMIVGSEGKRRVEYKSQGKDVIDIIIPRLGITWRLNPAEKRYVEFKREPTATPSELLANPCAGQKNFICEDMGKEQVNGRAANKWQITVPYKKQNITMLRWIDLENGFPLIQKMPNGQIAEMHLVGEEEIDGRSVQKWELRSKWNERSASSFQWYDPVLKLAIREEGREGIVNTLKKIQQGPQPEHLFQVPSGYEKDAPLKQGGLKVVPIK